jgi:hypothetical protein
MQLGQRGGHWEQVSLGQSVAGSKCRWEQVSLGRSVAGNKCRWEQVSLGQSVTLVGGFPNVLMAIQMPVLFNIY